MGRAVVLTPFRGPGLLHRKGVWLPLTLLCAAPFCGF